MAIKYRMIAVDEECIEMLEKCKEEYIKHNPSMKHVPISKRKLIKEMAVVYLRI